MDDINDIKQRMDGAIAAYKADLAGLRTGRASPSLLEPIMVNAYGSNMPMNQVGNINAPEPKLLTVQVWDAGLVSSVEKAINDSGLGLSAMADGQLVRVPVPELSEERRAELVKIAAKYAENARVAVRNVRRDGIDGVKKEDISDDEKKAWEEDIQSATDEFIKQIDSLLKEKEADIMTV